MKDVMTAFGDRMGLEPRLSRWLLTRLSGVKTIRTLIDGDRAASEAHLAALEQLRHSDRVSTLGRLASSIAHELGNPLNVIELRAQLIASGDADTMERIQHSARIIVEQTQRMTRIIDEVLSFARMQPARIARIDLAVVVRKAIALSEHTAKKHRSTVSLDVPNLAIELDGDEDKLLQIIVNLVVNGIQSMPQGGPIRVTVSDEHHAPLHEPEGSPQHYVCIGVSDRGTGISPENIPKVFQPFFSTKGSDGGTGLGLSVAQGIAHEHEGWIDVTSELGQGSTFKVYLPKQRAERPK
ncbi:MAG TPA: ATP-binding protein [Polyangiaceae bacterium]|nr:ATP-binding protein [Polyangiaceae bacterium]